MKFDLLAPPKGPRRRGPKKLCHCMCHSYKYITHQIWLNWGKKVFGPPTPPWYPQVPPLGHDPGVRMKIPSDIFHIFQLWEDTQSLVKKPLKLTLWLRFNDIWPFGPSRGPQGVGAKKLCCCMCHWCKLLTHQIWLNFGKQFFFDHSTPHGTPKSDPWGMTQVREWKSRPICFMSYICEKTHKVWFKNLWNWLCNWNLIIFDLLAPPQGPRGWGKKNVPLHTLTMWATHTPNLVEFRPTV